MINLFNYSYDFLLNIKNAVGIKLKTATIVAWLDSIINPLRELHSTFYSFVEDTKYDLSIDGTVIQLERLLNDKYDNVNRSINIKNIEDIRLYLFKEDDVSLEKKYLFRDSQEFESNIGGEFDYVIPAWAATQIPPSNGELFDQFYNNYLFTEEELENNSGFIINIPSTLSSQNSSIIADVNRKKIAGKTYTINYF